MSLMCYFGIISSLALIFYHLNCQFTGYSNVDSIGS